MEKAADACKQLIDEAEKKGKGLYIVNNKENGKVDPFMSCYGATMRTEGEGNNEIIWFRPKEITEIGNSTELLAVAAVMEA